MYIEIIWLRLSYHYFGAHAFRINDDSILITHLHNSQLSHFKISSYIAIHVVTLCMLVTSLSFANEVYAAKRTYQLAFLLISSRFDLQICLQWSVSSCTSQPFCVKSEYSIGHV